MAASRFIEEESGTYTARIRHPHNGYYAGEFSPTALLEDVRPVETSVPTLPAR